MQNLQLTHLHYIEHKVAEFVVAKVSQAAELYIKQKTAGEKVRFEKLIKTVWKTSNFGTFYVDDQDLVKQFPIMKDHGFKITRGARTAGGNRAECAHNGDKFLGIVVCAGEINQAESEQDIRKAVHDLEVDIFHECDHIMNPADYGSLEDLPEDKVKQYNKFVEYYSHPVEIRAFSRQIAYDYYKKVPGTKYNLDWHLKAVKNSGSTTQIALKWILLFKDPKKFRGSDQINNFIDSHLCKGLAVKSVPEVNRVYQFYMAYISEFLDHFNNGIPE